MSRFPNRRWLVVPATDVETIDFNQVLEHSAEGLRYSIDKTKTFVKYEVNEITASYSTVGMDAETGEEISILHEAGVYGRPSFYLDSYSEYTHSEILALLSTDEWTDQDVLDSPS